MIVHGQVRTAHFAKENSVSREKAACILVGVIKQVARAFQCMPRGMDNLNTDFTELKAFSINIFSHLEAVNSALAVRAHDNRHFELGVP